MTVSCWCCTREMDIFGLPTAWSGREPAVVLRSVERSMFHPGAPTGTVQFRLTRRKEPPMNGFDYAALQVALDARPADVEPAPQPPGVEVLVRVARIRGRHRAPGMPSIFRPRW